MIEWIHVLYDAHGIVIVRSHVIRQGGSYFIIAFRIGIPNHFHNNLSDCETGPVAALANSMPFAVKVIIVEYSSPIIFYGSICCDAITLKNSRVR
ncbi:MAG: hypothetical protein R2764_13005 [Bacteroidales bacterium]